VNRLGGVISSLLIGLVILLFGLSGAARGQVTNQVMAEADKHCQAGIARQAAADMAGSKPEARRLYREALAQYQAAVAVQPDNYQAQVLWATSLTRLIPLADNEPDRARLIREADQRFAAASRCPGPDHIVFDQWAGLRLNHLDELAPQPEQRVALLRQVVALAERGLAVATEPTPRAKLQFRLGDALMQLTATEPDPGRQRALLERAVDQLRAASRSVTVRQLLYEVNYLGIALLSLGRLTGNPALLREAVDELESALKFYPNQYDTHFNLAATWSLLGDAEQAAQHLAVAIDHDPDGAYSRQAAADPDLAPVRGTAAYAAALDRRRRQAAEANGLALLEQARRSRQQAETTNDLPAAALLWTQVLTLGEQAIRFTPDQFTAHLLCATALEQLSQSTANYPALQRRHLDAARQRFAAAARCPGADAAFYDQWSTFLLDRYHPLLGDPAERQQLLTEARQVLEDGIARARFSGIRSRLESRLGSCLVQLARQEPAPANATALYTRALRHFEATTATDQPPQTPRVNELWGWALLRTGQADREKMQIRRGIEQFLRALELQPDNAAAEYGLACAYGQLRQFDQALRHLERSLHNDPQGLFQRRAEQDVDLRALRQTEGFARLFRPRPPLDTITRPTISVK